jgi:N-carbamoyl-L-amino-acid hydrolase
VLAALHSLPQERVAFSDGDLQARARSAELMAQAGLTVTIDDAFNVVGSCPGREDLEPIMLGSHIDTVPNPGRFDGALGVMTAIESARVLAAEGDLRHPLRVYAFSDEEGSLTQGCWGARAVAGQLDPDELEALADPSSALAQRLLAAARRLSELGWSVRPLAASHIPRIRPAAYLELHIEQGPVLERAGNATGAVTSIVGINRYEVVIYGQSGHAGTVPMSERGEDVAMRLAGLMEQYWAQVLRLGARAVVNFGRIALLPGSFNVIPGEARVAIEIRSPQTSVLTELEAALERLAAEAEAAVEVVGRDAPVGLDNSVRAATLEAAAEEGVACAEVPSWAGHDAAVMASVTRAGMIFVPSVEGASHCPREQTTEGDVEAGLRVFLRTITRLDKVLS